MFEVPLFHLKIFKYCLSQMSNIPQEVQGQYNKLKGEYSQLFKRYIELEDERREHSLVLTNLEPFLQKGDRRCWKVIGGILVQKTLPQTIESLQQNVMMLEQTIKALDSEMSKRQKEVLDLELKYNLNPTKKGSEHSIQEAKTGVLA